MMFDGLEVAMDDGRRVCRLECVRNLGGHAKARSWPTGPACRMSASVPPATYSMAM